MHRSPGELANSQPYGKPVAVEQYIYCQIQSVRVAYPRGNRHQRRRRPPNSDPESVTHVANQERSNTSLPQHNIYVFMSMVTFNYIYAFDTPNYIYFIHSSSSSSSNHPSYRFPFLEKGQHRRCAILQDPAGLTYLLSFWLCLCWVLALDQLGRAQV